jgi:hypothetical protein
MLLFLDCNATISGITPLIAKIVTVVIKIEP